MNPSISLIWVHGDAYCLPELLVDFVRVVRQYPRGLAMNDYLRLTCKLREARLASLWLGEINLQEVPLVKVVPRILLAESERPHFFDLTLILVDGGGQQVPLFGEMAAFAFTGGGLLEVFKKKFDAYEFLRSLAAEVLPHSGELGKSFRSPFDRGRWDQVLTALSTEQSLECYDEDHQQVCFCETAVVHRLLAQLIACFDAHSFRFSHSSREEKKLVLQIRKNVLLENISAFYEKVSILGVELYYNYNKVEIWQSQVRCQRNVSQIDWFEIDMTLSKEDHELIQRADIEGGQFFNEQRMVLLSREQRDLLKFIKRYASFDKKPKSKGKDAKGAESGTSQLSLCLERAQIFELFELKRAGLEGVLTEGEIQFCESLSRLEEIPSYDVPARVQSLLRPYQVEGYRWLRFLWESRFGACLADDMGLGKTIQTISFLQSVVEQMNRIIIVCPVSILVNWIEEFDKFSDLSGDICLYYGGDRELDLDKKIILTSYGVIRREVDSRLGGLVFDIMVLDEVQNLKNIRSLGAESVRKMKAKFHVCLTGTPVENDLEEFYNIIDMAVPGIWGTRNILKKGDLARKDRSLVKKMARPFVLRRTKTQVLKDLPAKIENTVYLRFSDQERENYLYHLATVKNRLKHVVDSRRYGEVFKGLLELRQLCLWQHREALLSTKVSFLFKNMEQILEEGHQVLIFSQFTSYLDIIQQKLVQGGISFSRIDGSFSLKKREENAKRFQAGANKVFLISLKAGGLGLNLTAASYVYIMDPWWNPAVEAQAVDRAHRIGQTKPINVYRLIIKNSIEEKVLQLQQVKKQLFDDLLGSEGEQYFTGRLTMKDFEALLKP